MEDYSDSMEDFLRSDISTDAFLGVCVATRSRPLILNK
jgi:hypothetical protein